MPFDATARTPWAVPLAFEDYLELVDWAGRALRADKPGYIEAREPKILARLEIDGERFIDFVEHLLKVFGAPDARPSTCVASGLHDNAIKLSVTGRQSKRRNYESRESSRSDSRKFA